MILIQAQNLQYTILNFNFSLLSVETICFSKFNVGPFFNCIRKSPPTTPPFNHSIGKFPRGIFTVENTPAENSPIPSKNYCSLLYNKYYILTMTFVQLTTVSAGTVGSLIIPKGIVIGPFNYAESNSYLKFFDHMSLLGKGRERGLKALRSFWTLKKGTRASYFLSNEPSFHHLVPQVRYDHPWGKKNKDPPEPLLTQRASNRRVSCWVIFTRTSSKLVAKPGCGMDRTLGTVLPSRATQRTKKKQINTNP